MFRNYLITAIRSLRRYRLFTFLNVFGLSTGMACSILILLWVKDERSYDNFNPVASRIYRLTSSVSGSEAAVTPPPVAPALKAVVPAIEDVTRVVPLTTTVTAAGGKFNERNILYADSNFLEMFNYPLLEGDKNTALLQPDGVIITSAMALKYFGNTHAIGKSIRVDNGYANNYVVTGILADIPHNSHLQFDMLLPMSYYNISNGDDWGNFAVYSYVLLNERADVSDASISALEKKIDQIHKLNDKSNTASLFTLQPLRDVHLFSRLMLDVEGQGNNEYVNIFSIVAIFILVIACINFMNLSTALGGQRAKEVGLRKTIGASKTQLIVQFMGETLLVSVLSLLAGIAAAWLLLPFFNTLSGKSLSLDLRDAGMLGQLFLLTILVGLVSGSYPAFVMSSFNPIRVLKGIGVSDSRRPWLRNGLVVGQFAISVILMISTLVVNHQLKFIKGRDIGFNNKNLLYLELPQTGSQRRNYDVLNAALQAQPGLHDYTIVDHLPTWLTTGTTDVDWRGKDPAKQTVFPHLGVDEHFAQTFRMKILTGRTFDDRSVADADNYLLNEAALKVMGMTTSNAVGKQISSNGHIGTVIGVVKDFNFKPVRQPIEPLIIRHTNRAGFLVMRAAPQELQQLVPRLKTLFGEVYPDFPYQYGFVDQDLANLYVTEQRVGKLFNIFSVISIIISCLGLFGLATFATQRRLKEIGVRRVLGATATGIVRMLAWSFIGLVMLSCIVAFPVAWWMMNRWLDGYVYRIGISWWMFAVAGLLSMLIAFITISYQSVKAALTNPVKSLRSE